MRSAACCQQWLLCLCAHLWYKKNTIKTVTYCLLVTQTMQDVEGVRFAVTVKLRSPDTALLDFHTALTAAGRQVQPRYMSQLHSHTVILTLLMHVISLTIVHGCPSCVTVHLEFMLLSP